MVEEVNWSGDFGYFLSYFFVDLDSVFNVWFLGGRL